MKPSTLLLAAAIIGAPLGASFAAAPYPLTGWVSAVHDGDTLTILDPLKQQHKIRLAEIDAPEVPKQPFGDVSRQMLANLSFHKTCTVNVIGKSYDREVGEVYCEGVYVNEKMVEQGGAWVYTQYLKNKDLPAVQDTACKSKIGLWRLQPDQIIAPWNWRKHDYSPGKGC